MGPTLWPPGSSGSSWSLLQVDLVSIGHGRRVLLHEYRIDVRSIGPSTTTQSTCVREKIVMLTLVKDLLRLNVLKGDKFVVLRNTIY